jgi:hypothetical protein
MDNVKSQLDMLMKASHPIPVLRCGFHRALNQTAGEIQKKVDELVVLPSVNMNPG